ncbi:MAG TPA: hypothetical protein VG755_16730, partial [Nannocystaceae bacterium]|nr:hypothetical protein [Nannocystaceae bacterium]
MRAGLVSIVGIALLATACKDDGAAHAGDGTSGESTAVGSEGGTTDATTSGSADESGSDTTGLPPIDPEICMHMEFDN